jgi:hypothetical protein
MNLSAPQIMENFTKWTALSFSNKFLLYEVSHLATATVV